MSNQRTASQDEDLLLQDFSRNVTTKSWVLFSGNAVVVSAIPLCKLLENSNQYSSPLSFSRAFLAYSSNGFFIIFHLFYYWYRPQHIFSQISLSKYEIYFKT
jgi:hypothetical protein